VRENDPNTIQVIDAHDRTELLDIVAGNGQAWPVIWPKTGATLRSVHRISLASGGATKLLNHPSEASYYVLSGNGQVRNADETFELFEGSMIHVEPRTNYLFVANDGLELIGGPCPADPAIYSGAAGGPEQKSVGHIRLFHRDDPGVKVPLISRDARLIIWLGAGSKTANMNFVRIQPGEGNVPHIHAESEDTIYILEGRGTVADFDHDLRLDFGPDQVIHVPVGVRHAVYADKGERVVSVGGPAPADLGMLRVAGLYPL
jgi:mannose-6-phosphate isomerase-like protein (cupin superfamily)